MADSHDTQSHAQTSWIAPLLPTVSRGIGRAHPWIYHHRRTSRLQVGASSKPVPTLLLEHRSASRQNFVAPLLYITDRSCVIVTLPLGRLKTAVVCNLPQSHYIQIRIRSPVSRRGQLGRAGAIAAR